MNEARKVLTLLSVIHAPVHGLVTGLAGQFYTDEGEAPLSGHAYGIRCKLPETAHGEIAEEQKVVVNAATGLLKRELGDETAEVVLDKFKKLWQPEIDEHGGFVQITEYTSEVIKQVDDKYLDETQLANSTDDAFWKTANSLTLACMHTSGSLQNE